MAITRRDEIQNLQLSVLQEYFHIMMKEKYGEEKWIDKIIQTAEKAVKRGIKVPGYKSLVDKYKSEGRARITEKTIDITIIYALLGDKEIKLACSAVPSEEDVLFKHASNIEKDQQTYFDLIGQIKDDRNTFSHLGSYDDSIRIKTIEIDAVAHCYDFILYLIENNWGDQSEERRVYVAKYINDSYNLFLNLVEGSFEKKKSDIRVTNDVVVCDKDGVPVPGFRMVIQDRDRQVVDEWISEASPHSSTVNEGEYLIVMRQPPSAYKFSVPTRVLINKESAGKTIKIEAERRVVSSQNVTGNKDSSILSKRRRKKLSAKIATVVSIIISFFLYLTPVFILHFQNHWINGVDDFISVIIITLATLFFLALILLNYGIGGFLEAGEDIVWVSTMVGVLLLVVYGVFIVVAYAMDISAFTEYESLTVFITLLLITMSNGLRLMGFDEEIPKAFSCVCFAIVGALLLHYPVSYTESYIKQAPIRSIAANFISQKLELGDSSLVKKVRILDEDDNGRYIALAEVAEEKYIILFYKDFSSEKWYYIPKYSVESIENSEEQKKAILRMKKIFSWDQKQDLFAKERILQENEYEALAETVADCLGISDPTHLEMEVVDRDAYGRCMVLANMEDKMYMILIHQRDGSWKNIPYSYTIQELHEESYFEEEQNLKTACNWGQER